MKLLNIIFSTAAVFNLIQSERIVEVNTTSATGCRNLVVIHRPPAPPLNTNVGFAPTSAPTEASVGGGRELVSGPSTSAPTFSPTCIAKINELCPKCAFPRLNPEERRLCGTTCLLTYPVQVASACGAPPPPKKEDEFRSIEECKSIVSTTCDYCLDVSDPIGRTLCMGKCLNENKQVLFDSGCRPANATAPLDIGKNGTLDKCYDLFVKTCSSCNLGSGLNSLSTARECISTCFTTNKDLFVAERCVPPKPPAGVFDDSRLSKIVFKVDEFISKLPDGSLTVVFEEADKFSIKVEAQFPKGYFFSQTAPSEPVDDDSAGRMLGASDTGAASVEFSVTASGDKSGAESSSLINALLAGAATACVTSNNYQQRFMAGLASGIILSSFAEAAEDTCPVKIKVTVYHRKFGPIAFAQATQKFEVLKNAVKNSDVFKKEKDETSGSGSGRLLRSM